MKPLRRVRRALLPALQAAERRVHDLRVLFFELTQSCNLSCRHCGSDCMRDDAGPRLPAEAVLFVLRDVRERHPAHKITVVLTGGEPLCYPSLFALGRDISALGFPWGMVTNGFAWTEDTTAAARSAGLDTITVSLDGPEAEHDWLRGRAGSYERALGAIRMLTRDRFWQAMDVVTCVHPRNLSTLDAVHRLLAANEVPAWRLFTISPIGRAASHPELCLDREGMRALLEAIARYRRTGAMRVDYSESGYLGRELDGCVRDAAHFCRAGISIGGVMANGDILACPNIDRRFRQGNIAEDLFTEAWETRFREFRDRAWMRNGDCAACPEWNWCVGGSFHLRDPETMRGRGCVYRAYVAPAE